MRTRIEKVRGRKTIHSHVGHDAARLLLGSTIVMYGLANYVGQSPPEMFPGDASSEMPLSKIRVRKLVSHLSNYQVGVLL